MAKKKTAAKKAKPAARTRKTVAATPPERVIGSYRVVYMGGREPASVSCHGVNVYGSCCEFVRFEETARDPDGEWVSVLVLPAASFERVEFIDPNPTDVALIPGTNTPFYGDGITDVTEAPQ